MSKSHSKKRNSLLVQEFMIRWMSTALVEGREAEAKVALAMIKKYYRPGTELYKEYRLANSLVQATVSNTSTAASILSEAKRASRAHDTKRLEAEKFRLINEINNVVKDPLFWDRPVPMYKTMATVQTLINDWRKDVKDIDLIRLATYEDQLVNWLTSSKNAPASYDTIKGNAGEDRLLLRIMSKKLEEKYGNSLTSLQRVLMREYVLMQGSTVEGKEGSFLDNVDDLKGKLVELMDEYIRSKSSQDYEVKKLIDLRSSINEGMLSRDRSMDDSYLMDAMDCAKLLDELGSDE